MQTVFPKYEKHVDDHLNISSVLAFSEQQDALIAAQQQVTQRVMDNNQMLREALRQEHERAEKLQQSLNQLQAENQALQARIEQLESRPINVAGDYIEKMNIEKYLALKPKSKTKYKLYDLTNQLPLWTNQETST